MGKKIKIVAEDPILSKNIKYEKRSKARQLEKAKSEEERAQELRRKKEMLEVERKVDRQIESITSALTPLRTHHTLKQRIFTHAPRSEDRTSRTARNIPELVFNNGTKVESVYDYHFGLVASEERIVREKRSTIKQKIEEQTREEIKSMFGTTHIEEEKPEEESLEGEAYNLLPDCKKESEAKINGEVYLVSQLFTENKDVLAPSAVQLEDKALDNAQMLVRNYFDHVFIENDQEQKIEQFRKIVIAHAVEHLERCFKAEKGRGFTNCKVLILTPFFGDAKAIMEIIEERFEGYQVVNGEKLEEVEEDNDFFRVGIKIAKKKEQLTYFSHFDHSEFIIASPVGLKSIIGSEGDAKREHSFISSVDLLYVDRASVLLMQNWAHLTEILKNINYMPKYESLKNSIDSIRDTFLELKGRLYRQNIVFSEYNFPELNALKQSHFHNIQGIATSKLHYPRPPAPSAVEHSFYKIEVKHPREDLETRFDYFKRKFWDDLHNKESMSKVVLFVSSYFQFVKLKAFLEKVNASAQYICEHTSQKKVQSRMAKFNSEQFRILLVTERAYYFEVCQIKKFRQIYFYSLPKNSFIFSELVGSVEGAGEGAGQVVSIYTRFDLLVLERIVGSAKAVEMVREYCNNVSFIL